MLMSSLSALPPVSAAETAMTDDLLSVQGIPVEHTPEIALYGAGNTSPDEQAAYPEDIYSSTMGYDVLNDAQKSLYRKIKAAAHAFYTGTAAAEGVSYGSDEEKLPCFAVVSNTDSSLSNEDTVKVISMFRNDNPMYFFVGNNYLYSMDYDFENGKKLCWCGLYRLRRGIHQRDGTTGGTPCTGNTDHCGTGTGGSTGYCMGKSQSRQ